MAEKCKSTEQEPLDLRITISFREKPNADRCKTVFDFIEARGTICKQLLRAFDTSKISTQAGVGNECAMIILSRTCQWKTPQNCYNVLRNHFIGRKAKNVQIPNNVTSIRVIMCDQTDKKLLEQSDCSRIESTNAEIGRRGASQSNLERPEIASDPSEIGSGGSQGKSVSAAFKSVRISFCLASGNFDRPDEALLKELRSKASEAIIDVECQEKRGLMVCITCVLKNPIHSYNLRRQIQNIFPVRPPLKVNFSSMDEETVREEYNTSEPVHSKGRRWLHFSLDQCAAFEMPLSELAERLRASAEDEQRRFLACITREDFEKDAKRKQLLISNLAAVLTVVARKCSDTAAHGPLASEITVSGSMLQARAGTEPAPPSTPVAPQSLQQTPMTTSSDPVIPVASSASVWNQATPGPRPEASPVKGIAAGRLGNDSDQAIPAPKTPAHGPSASEITVLGPPSVQEARTGTEPGQTLIFFCQRLAIALTRVWVSFTGGIFIFSGESAKPPHRSPNKSSPSKDIAAGRLGKDSAQAIPAPQTAAAAGPCKRKRVKPEDDGGADCGSRSGSKKALPLKVFGDMGRENEARLTEQIDAMRKTEESGSRKVDLHVERPKERRFDGNPTSGGEVGRFTIRCRQRALREIRGAYGNLCADWHCERGCGCEKTRTYVGEDGSAPSAIVGGGLMQAAASVGSPQAAESQPEGAAVAAEGGSEPWTAQALAEHLVETMAPEVRQEFALADVEASTLSEGDRRVVLKGIGLLRKAGGLPMEDQQRVKAEIANLKAPAEVVLMEEKKEHIKIIVAGIISDMLPVMQKLTALDPRIQRWSLANSPRFKQRIIDQYKAELSARRKCEIGLLKAAGTFAKHNLSSQAYRGVRTVLCDLGFRHVLPTVKDLDDARKHIEKNAAMDLELRQTEDGWFCSIRALIEMELLRMQQRVTTQSKSTRKESGARSIGNVGPEMNGWQDEIQVKITLDARSITKKTSQTEVMMHIFKRGEEGSEDSQSALCMRTVGIFMGKDSREGVQANATEFFQECQDLAVRGVLFNIKEQAFLGQLEAFSQMSEEKQVADKTAEKNVRTYFPVSVKFWSPADMAAQCAILGHGCAGHHYCAHCMAHADERHLPYALRTLDEDTNFSALAHELDMHPKTLFALTRG